MDTQTQVDHGALVGWTGQDLGQRVVLTMQSVTKPPPHGADDVHDFLFMMDRKQAVQLGYYLFQLTGEAAPTRHKRSVLEKIFGG
ncbi:hypothetical protein [Altererythrobacter sp. MF3-039]|uniref:hypothetical protein n=1 Tax=Altererythrobacter sp. MF3-039 TaxID=3252901 RepID=UPI00390C9BC3